MSHAVGQAPTVQDRGTEGFGESGSQLPAPSSQLLTRRTVTGCLLALLFVVTGCKVGPDYARPEVPEVTDWRWKPAEPRDAVPRGTWWQVFEDPVLDGLEMRAMEGNFDLQAAMSRVEQGRSIARISRSAFYPDVQGGVNWTRYRTSGNSPSPVPPFTVPSFTQEQFTVPFDLSYEVDVWGKVRRSFEASQQLALGAEAALHSVLLTLQADVAVAYFDLKSLDQQIALLDDAVALRRDAVTIFEQRLEAGMGADFELQRSRAELASAEADLLAVRLSRAQTFNSLAVFCGVPPSEFELELPPGETRVPALVPDLPSTLLERRPDVAEAERELAARNAEIGVAKGAFFPVVRLTAAGGFLSAEAQDLFNWQSRVWQLSPSITFPVFQGGRNRASLARAKAAYEEAVALYRRQILVAFGEVEDNLAAMRFLEAQTTARQEAATAATAAAKLSVARYQAGSVDFLGVVDSENVRLLNEQLRVVALKNQLLATVRLIKALGGGWE